jgi:hypothetical protein
MNVATPRGPSPISLESLSHVAFTSICSPSIRPRSESCAGSGLSVVSCRLINKSTLVGVYGGSTLDKVLTFETWGVFANANL